MYGVFILALSLALQLWPADPPHGCEQLHAAFQAAERGAALLDLNSGLRLLTQFERKHEDPGRCVRDELD